MGRISLGTGAKFLYDDRSYVVINEMEDENFECKNIASGRKKVFPKFMIIEKLEKGELIFSEEGKNTTDDVIRKNVGADFSMLSEKQKETAKFRLYAIEPLLEINDVSLDPYVVERVKQLIKEGMHHKGFKFSRASIYRWIKSYRNSNQNIWSLVSIYDKCGPKGKLIHPEVETIIQRVIDHFYMRREAVNPKDVYELVIHEVDKVNEFRKQGFKLPYPSEATVYRRVQQRDMEDVARAKKGGRFAYHNYRQIKLQKKPDRPLQRVEIDHTKLDLFLINFLSEKKVLALGRPTVTTVLDVCSGYPLGFYIGYEPPSYHAVMHALNHAISPKNYVKELYPEVENSWDCYGLPELLVTDRGKEFLSKHLEDACAHLGIKLEHTPGKAPWYKGAIERHFKTINQQLIHKVPGTSFSNIFEKGDYDPKKNAIMTLQEFMRVLHVWLIDYYAQSKNEGVKGVPALIWERGLKEYGEPDLPASKFDWEIALMKVDHGSIQRHGIRRDYLIYSSPMLRTLQAELRKKGLANTVDIKYDPSDLGAIYVYNSFDKSYFKVACTDQEYASGLNEYAHKINRKLAEQEIGTVNLSALARAKAKIFEIIYGGMKKVLSFDAGRLMGVGSNEVLDPSPHKEERKPAEKTKPQKVEDILSNLDMSNWRSRNDARRY